MDRYLHWKRSRELKNDTDEITNTLGPGPQAQQYTTWKYTNKTLYPNFSALHHGNENKRDKHCLVVKLRNL